MTQSGTQRTQDQQIRATYEEYKIVDTNLALISDPENESAWIQSDQTVEIQP